MSSLHDRADELVPEPAANAPAQEWARYWRTIAEHRDVAKNYDGARSAAAIADHYLIVPGAVIDIINPVPAESFGERWLGPVSGAAATCGGSCCGPDHTMPGVVASSPAKADGA